MLDMGFAVPLDDALYLGRALAEHDVFFLEEPLSPDDLNGFARLDRRLADADRHRREGNHAVPVSST